ncbi:hypothetical protein DV736_g5374, partial [Chaetothyriales sp. CBS 134916]
MKQAHTSKFPALGISSLAFSHASNPATPTPPDLRLAGRTVEQVVWTQDVIEAEEEEECRPATLRLFSIGGSAAVTEWDLGVGVPKRQAEGNCGDIWCFAAQPRPQAAATTANTTSINNETSTSTGTSSQLLAAGCSDGSIVLFSTEDNDLRFSRVLLPRPAARKAKVLSLAWRDANTVVAGYEKGSIRLIDVPSRRTLQQVTLGNSANARARSVVWTVKCLPDGTVVSGDSAGELKVWDARNLSLVQTLRTHQSDILDIACNANGDRLWTVGIDRRTVSYQLSKVPGVITQRWMELYHRQLHKNDAKCVAVFESADVGVLQQIHVYHMAKRNQAGQAVEQKKAHSLVGTLQLKGDQDIESAAISEDGNLIVASTSAGVRLFQVRVDTGGSATTLRSRQIDLPASLQRFGARLVGISPNLKWLYAIRMDNTVVVCKVLAGATARDKPRIHRAITKLVVPSTRTLPTLGGGAYMAGICAAAFSPDSRVIAVGTLGGTIAAWVLTGHEDESGDGASAPNSESNSDDDDDSDSDESDDEESDTPTIDSQRWVATPERKVARFPQLDNPITVLTFRPSSSSSALANSNGNSNGNIGLHATRRNAHPIAHEQPATAPQLLAVSADGTVSEVDVYTGRLSEWWRQNSEALRVQLGWTKDVMRGCFWDTKKKRQRLWLYGNMVVQMLDKEKKCWSTFEYRAILGAGVIGEEEVEDDAEGMDIDDDDKKNIEVVIIERPLWDVQAAA